MRISDWSSDVCSSDLALLFVLWTRALTPRGVAIDLGSPAADSLGRSGLPGGVDTQFWARFGLGLVKNGRTSCRESVCQYVSIWWVAVSLQTQCLYPHTPETMDI